MVVRGVFTKAKAHLATVRDEAKMPGKKMRAYDIFKAIHQAIHESMRGTQMLLRAIEESADKRRDAAPEKEPTSWDAQHVVDQPKPPAQRAIRASEMPQAMEVNETAKHKTSTAALAQQVADQAMEMQQTAEHAASTVADLVASMRSKHMPPEMARLSEDLTSTLEVLLARSSSSLNSLNEVRRAVDEQTASVDVLTRDLKGQVQGVLRAFRANVQDESAPSEFVSSILKAQQMLEVLEVAAKSRRRTEAMLIAAVDASAAQQVERELDQVDGSLIGRDGVDEASGCQDSDASESDGDMDMLEADPKTCTKHGARALQRGPVAVEVGTKAARRSLIAVSPAAVSPAAVSPAVGSPAAVSPAARRLADIGSAGQEPEDSCSWQRGSLEAPTMTTAPTRGVQVPTAPLATGGAWPHASTGGFALGDSTRAETAGQLQQQQQQSSSFMEKRLEAPALQPIKSFRKLRLPAVMFIGRAMLAKVRSASSSLAPHRFRSQRSEQMFGECCPSGDSDECRSQGAGSPQPLASLQGLPPDDELANIRAAERLQRAGSKKRSAVVRVDSRQFCSYRAAYLQVDDESECAASHVLDPASEQLEMHMSGSTCSFYSSRSATPKATRSDPSSSLSSRDQLIQKLKEHGWAEVPHRADGKTPTRQHGSAHGTCTSEGVELASQQSCAEVLFKVSKTDATPQASKAKDDEYKLEQDPHGAAPWTQMEGTAAPCQQASSDGLLRISVVSTHDDAPQDAAGRSMQAQRAAFVRNKSQPQPRHTAPNPDLALSDDIFESTDRLWDRAISWSPSPDMPKRRVLPPLAEDLTIGEFISWEQSLSGQHPKVVQHPSRSATMRPRANLPVSSQTDRSPRNSPTPGAEQPSSHHVLPPVTPPPTKPPRRVPLPHIHTPQRPETPPPVRKSPPSVLAQTRRHSVDSASLWVHGDHLEARS